jgi:hypothetical protein
MVHFHPHRRLTITLGARFRVLPSLSICRRGRVACGGFYGSWLGVYVEYNHLSSAWMTFRSAELNACER